MMIDNTKKMAVGFFVSFHSQGSAENADLEQEHVELTHGLVKLGNLHMNSALSAHFMEKYAKFVPNKMSLAGCAQFVIG